METAAEKRGPRDLTRSVSADDFPMAKVARLSECPEGQKEEMVNCEADAATKIITSSDVRRHSACGNTNTVDCIADCKTLRHEASCRTHNSPHKNSPLRGDIDAPGSPHSRMDQPILTLRQRLAKKAACGSPEPTGGLLYGALSSPLLRHQNEEQEEQQQQQQQHRMLGGLSLQWRLTLRAGAQSGAKRRATVQQKDQERTSASGSKEAQGVHTGTQADIGESIRPSVASLGSVGVMSEDVLTTPPSRRSAAVLSEGMPTPVPPSQNIGSHLTRRSEKVEDDAPFTKHTMQEHSSPALNRANAPKSAKELKALLGNQGINCDTCTCREDLEALWRLHVEISGGQTEQEPCSSTGATDGGQESVSMRCKQSASLPESSPCLEKRGTMAPEPANPPDKEIANGMNLSARKQAAEEEISRLLGLNQDTFASRARWAFSVLRLPLSGAGATIAAVQHAYRGLMRTLHPDRVGPLLGLSQAIEVLRKARAESERTLEREVAPGQPRSLRAQVLCADAGLHRVRLEWEAPAMQREAPVRSYVIAAVDPAYGRALTVAKIEPDFSEELNRFVSIEELVSFVLAEQEMPKMSSLFRQPSATFQVAAANKAGQSPWSMVKVALKRPVAKQEAIGSA